MSEHPEGAKGLLAVVHNAGICQEALPVEAMSIAKAQQIMVIAHKHTSTQVHKHTSTNAHKYMRMHRCTSTQAHNSTRARNSTRAHNSTRARCWVLVGALVRMRACDTLSRI